MKTMVKRRALFIGGLLTCSAFAFCVYQALHLPIRAEWWQARAATVGFVLMVPVELLINAVGGDGLPRPALLTLWCIGLVIECAVFLTAMLWSIGWAAEHLGGRSNNSLQPTDAGAPASDRDVR